MRVARSLWARVNHWLDEHPRTVLFVFVVCISGAILANAYVNHGQDSQLRRIVTMNRQLALQGKEAHDAICNLRANTNRQIAASEKFLDTHPEGFAGIPASAIRKSIDDQRRANLPLQALDCTT